MSSPVESVLGAILERIRATARIETVVGEPRTVEGRSVIPVARLAFGFGGGAGSARRAGTAGADGPSGGGGGGVSLTPLGFLVVTPTGERFVAVRPRRREFVAAFLLGIVTGAVAARRSRRHQPTLD